MSQSTPCLNNHPPAQNSDTKLTVNKDDPESGLTLPETETDGDMILKTRTPMYKTPLPGQNPKWHRDEDLSIDWGALFYGMGEGFLYFLLSTPYIEQCGREC